MVTPGISVRQIESMRGIGSFSSVVFDNVRVPADAMLGAENDGWHVITQALNYERIRSSGLDVALSALVATPGAERAAGMAAQIWDELVRSRGMVLDEMKKHAE